MTPDAVRARRKALGLSVRTLAVTAGMRRQDVSKPPDEHALARLDEALTALERGVPPGIARRRARPGKRGPKPARENVHRNSVDKVPLWPAHGGWAAEQQHLPANCFVDAVTRDAGIGGSDRPATVVLRQSSLGN